jgi:hypothetical protein
MKTAISNSMLTGSVRLQPQYFDAPRWGLLLEVDQAEFLFQPPTNKALRLLETRWMQWQKQRALIDADFRREHLARVEAVKVEIDAAQRQQLMDDAEEKQRVYFAADAAETQKFVDALCEHSQKRWRTAAEARLRRATNAINAEINRRDRELLARKRRSKSKGDL